MQFLLYRSKFFAPLLLVFFCASLAPCLAEEPSKRSCRVLFPERPGDAPKKLYLFDGLESQEVVLPKMNFSPTYELPGGPLRITFLTEPVVYPNLPPPGAPSITIPETLTDIYLIVQADRSNEIVPVRMNVIDAGSGRLRNGQMLWINTTDKTIGGFLGSDEIMVGKHSRMVSDPPLKKAGYYTVRLGYHNEEDGRAYPICQTKWRHDPRSRNVAFVLAKPGVRTPRILVYADFRRQQKPQEP